MALTGEAFGLSLGINVIIALGVFLFYGAIRRAGGLSKFYQPKRLVPMRLYSIALARALMLKTVSRTHYSLYEERFDFEKLYSGATTACMKTALSFKLS